MLQNSLFRAVKLNKHADFDKSKYSGYGTGFYTQRSFLLSNGSWFGKNVKCLVLIWGHLGMLVIKKRYTNS